MAILTGNEGISETFTIEDVADRNGNSPVPHVAGGTASLDTNAGRITGGHSDDEIDRQLATLGRVVNRICGEVLTCKGRVLRPPDNDRGIAQAFSEFIGPNLGNEEHLEPLPGQSQGGGAVLVNVEGPYSETEEEGVEATGTVRPHNLEGAVSQNPTWISRQFVDGEELNYLYWDPKVEPKVGPGADADEDEEGNEGNSERGVEAEVVSGSSTEAGNILGEEDYGEEQSGTDEQSETESNAKGADLDHEGSLS